jgi:hypothetical protein
MTEATRWILGGAAVAVASLLAASPVMAGGNGLTCAEKYRAAMATGTLKQGVTKSVFMERCASEARSEQTRKRKPRRS